MRLDPKLDFMYRYFGTYLLQSSFIFLILAQKLGKQADDLILDTCTANLNMLELFNRVTNIDYQKSFANLLRQTINRTMPERQTDIAVATDGGQDCSQDDSSYEDLLRSELSRYRWTEGYRGLWIADSEYPGELCLSMSDIFPSVLSKCREADKGTAPASFRPLLQAYCPSLIPD
jgi:xylanolytic transcriptional activator XlnR